MRIILFIFLLCFTVTPAYAYKEDNRSGETQFTASEQNTNLHKLSSQGVIAVKKLKKASEYVERSKAAGRSVNATAFEDILISDKAEEEKQELTKLTEIAAKLAETPQQLKVSDNHSVYETLDALQAVQSRDIQIARNLAQQLKRQRR